MIIIYILLTKNNLCIYFGQLALVHYIVLLEALLTVNNKMYSM